MRREEDCEPEGKYLIADRIISNNLLESLKKEASSRFEPHKLGNDKEYELYINWNKGDNEIVLFTWYAYADFKIPKKFDCIFELDNPDNFIIADFRLTQSIYEFYYPIDSIEHGHKHICVFKFKNNIPEIIDRLYVANLNSTTPQDNSMKLGFCQSADFEAIKTRILWRIENE